MKNQSVAALTSSTTAGARQSSNKLDSALAVAALQCCSSKLSDHFTLAEMCKTKANLENVPNEAQVKNLKRLCGWLEMRTPVRAFAQGRLLASLRSQAIRQSS